MFQVKREDPSRVFEIGVTIVDNSYVLSSNPLLPNMTSLQEILNETDNLAGLLVYARKCFKKVG